MTWLGPVEIHTRFLWGNLQWRSHMGDL